MSRRKTSHPEDARRSGIAWEGDSGGRRLDSFWRGNFFRRVALRTARGEVARHLARLRRADCSLSVEARELLGKRQESMLGGQGLTLRGSKRYEVKRSKKEKAARAKDTSGQWQIT